MVLSCPSCGAGVNAAPAAEPYVHTCRFCSARVPIEPLVPRRPPGIPETVQSGTAAREAALARARAANAAATTTKTVARGIGCFVTLMTLLPVVIVGVVFAGPWLSSYVSGRFGTFPISVPMNGSLEIDDRTGDANGAEQLVTVGMNGKLILRRCHLRGPLIVKAGVNAEVTVADSTLEGTKGIIEGDTNLLVHIQNSTITSGEEIVDAPVNPKIDISRGSKVHSEAVAFPLEVNPEISIDHSTVDGKLGALELKMNGHVKLTDGALVQSDGPAIDLTRNGHIAIMGSRVESKTEALRAGANVEGTIRTTILVGPKGALEVGDSGRLTLTQTTVTGPRKIAASAKIDER